ncbi:MAG: TlpA family protein disulfide reductase, partial [Verrucomicrobiae bacterium]|nr:TlpA family protein disulfide reductase [Verrucomicrobiae bacterium]
MKFALLILLLSASYAIADLSRFSSADELWGYIAKLQEGPVGADPHQPNFRDVLTAFQKEVEGATAEFERRYPFDARRWEARLFRLEVLMLMEQLFEVAMDHGAALEQLKAVAESDAPTAIQRQARRLARQIENARDRAALIKQIRSAPLELKFAAVDGREVDLEKLRGKVVLVDFWATWCGPCVMEAPKLVDTYQKYRERGFEIIGVSLDSNKERLMAFTERAGMT